jgi:hypothetical protein
LKRGGLQLHPQLCQPYHPQQEEVILVHGQSTPLDTVTPKKYHKRQEVFNSEMIEALKE